MKLTVCCITYNQEKYIGQMLDGIVNQRTDFDFEVMIGEDQSTDRTRKIIEEYQSKYPGLITILPGNENLGVRKNFAKTLLSGCGEYAAVCEGDDYWTDPLKLQKQVDYLDAHPDTDLCFHNTEIFYEDSGRKELSNPPGQPVITDLHDLISKWYIMTCSMVYRRNFSALPGWFTKVFNTDYALQMIISSNGSKVAYLPDTMAVYRKHEQGESAKVWGDDPYFWLLFLFNKLKETVSNSYGTTISKRKKEITGILAGYYSDQLKRKDMAFATKIKMLVRLLAMKMNMPGMYYKKFLQKKQLA